MRTFFTSDTHFGDHRVLNLYPRPFASVAQMDAELIGLWNATVGPQDEVWHLGDFARTPAKARAALGQLNGRKHLVVGNNDVDPSCEDGWASVAPYVELEREGRLIVLCHYPFQSWNGQHKGSLHLHGHSHGRLAPLPRRIDVGVDAQDYRPVALEALLAAARRPARAGGR